MWPTVRECLNFPVSRAESRPRASESNGKAREIESLEINTDIIGIHDEALARGLNCNLDRPTSPRCGRDTEDTRTELV